MNPNTDKLVRRTTMVATVTAGYFLLTADYGPEPNVLDPVFLLRPCVVIKPPNGRYAPCGMPRHPGALWGLRP
ncbi:hypothetical protein HanHA300_Chr16g0623471 [Helianthus annuus]|nr:hypothetical protein HanHA300_Chr16g0623471 [Helianthus annuus]